MRWSGPPKISCSVLVTAEDDFINSDAAYHEVMGGAAQLSAMAHDLLPTDKSESLSLLGTLHFPVPARYAVSNFVSASLAPAETPPQPSGIGPLDAVAAIASAVPQALALLTSTRSITSKAPSPDQLAAAASIAGSLSSTRSSGIEVLHDTFRLLPPGDVVDNQLNQLKLCRQALVDLDSGTNRSSDDSKLTAATPGGVADAARRKGLVSAIDAFLTAAFAVGGEGKRAPVVQAKARSILHSGPDRDRQITHLLLVRAASGSTSQLVEDRPLLMHDKVSVVASSSVTYLLLECDTNRVVAGGTESGLATINGTIGSAFEFGAISVSSFPS